MPKRCPICGEPLEDGLCIVCGYGAFTDNVSSDILDDDSHRSKHHDSLIDDILDFAIDVSDDF